MAYTTDEKSTGLDLLTAATLAQGDLHIVGDVSDSGRAKAITENELEDYIANSSNFINELTANATFITNIETIAPSPLTTKGDIFTHNATVPARLPVGTDGQILSVDSAETTGLKWITSAIPSGIGTKIFISTTESTVTGTVTETNLFAPINIPGGTLSTNNAIRFKVLGSAISIANSQTNTIRLKYGATTIATLTLGTGLTAKPFEIEGYIIADGSSSAQKGFMRYLSEFSTLNAYAEADDGTATEVSTGALNLTLTAEASNNTDCSITVEAIIVEKISSSNQYETVLGRTSTAEPSMYQDQDGEIGTSGTVNIYVQLPGAAIQQRDVTTDWASADAINSLVLLGGYLYVLLVDTPTGTMRVYRYDATNIAAGGTLMTIAGQAFGTSVTGGQVMTSNGTDFYFLYDGNTSGTREDVASYSLSGTTLTYITTVTLTGANADLGNMAVMANGDIYALSSSITGKLFDSTGSSLGTFPKPQLGASQRFLNLDGTIYVAPTATSPFSKTNITGTIF